MINFVGPKLFRTELAAMFAQISADNNVHVREKIASRFHEVRGFVLLFCHNMPFAFRVIIKICGLASSNCLRFK